mmetsp:Transcript_66970/g.160427  ORF Transcript_66970/g.160427 Transcript_66970/m.160427 type:complete len:283 (-) Transcript_66970:56-904(-)
MSQPCMMPMQGRGLGYQNRLSYQAVSLSQRVMEDGRQHGEVRTSGSSDSSIPSSAGALNRERLAEGLLEEGMDRAAASSSSPSRQNLATGYWPVLQDNRGAKGGGKGRNHCKGRGGPAEPFTNGRTRHRSLAQNGENIRSARPQNVAAPRHIYGAHEDHTRAFSDGGAASDTIEVEAAAGSWLGEPVPVWAQLDQITCIQNVYSSSVAAVPDSSTAMHDGNGVLPSAFHPLRSCVCPRRNLTGEAPHLCDICGGNVQSISRRKGRRRRGRRHAFHTVASSLE